MRNTFNISFYARNSKADKNGQTHLEMSINVNQKRLFINLPFIVEPNKFNSKRQPKEYTDYVSLMRTRVNEIMVEMMAHEEPITAERIREYVRTGGFKSYTINDLFSDFLSSIKTRIGVDMTMPVYRKYELMKDLFISQIDGTKEVNAITPQTISDFYIYLRKNYESTTAARYMKNLKTMIKYGLDNDKLKINPFQAIKIKAEKKPIEYLTEKEIEILENAKLENECLQNVLDCFLFQMNSGLAYADIVELTKNDIQTDGGTYFIKKRRHKTGVEYTAVILPFGVELLKKHNYNLRIISCQKLNAYLHVIEGILGLKTSLHTHLARHTYLTSLLNKGVRMETVSKAAGHSSVKVTEQFYAHLKSETIVNEVATAFNIK